MNQRSKLIGVVVCLMALSFFAALPFWKWFGAREVEAPLQARTRALVDANSALKPAWDVAMQDEVLTFPEAKLIIEAAGEKVDVESP